jgi:ribosomal protein S12 methylthiotransferase accessory factor
MDAFGITRVANLTGLDRTGIPVVMVCRPNARSSAVFHGKGVDLAAAKASGMMEAIETWHAEFAQLPLRLGSSAELRNSIDLIDIDGLPRAAANRYHPHLPLLWVEGLDLVGRRALWLPFETVHANATLPRPQGSGCFAASTNGLASGNHLLEATSHALCELIERDATSLWHRRAPDAQDETRLDLKTVDDDLCREVLKRFACAGVQVAAWEITTDVAVPAFQCLLLDDLGGFAGHGAGCHPTRHIALLRALTEAAQVRTTYIGGSREDIRYADYGRAARRAQDDRARAFMRPGSPMRNFEMVGQFDFETFEAEVAWLVERLQAVGVREVVAVDLTQAQFGIPVVRVVVPGIEGWHHQPGYVPGPRARAIEG